MPQIDDALTDIDKRIIDRLRMGSCGFNELCADLEKYISHDPLRERLEVLAKMGLVRWEKGRRGQKSVIELAESLARYEEKAECLKTMWADCFSKLEQLEESLKYGLVSQRDAGSMSVWLIYETLPLLASGLIETQLPSESRKRLSSFSAGKFCFFFDNVLQLREKYPEIHIGFQEGCKELSAHVKPIEERIEIIFEQLAELKAKKGKSKRN